MTRRGFIAAAAGAACVLVPEPFLAMNGAPSPCGVITLTASEKYYRRRAAWSPYWHGLSPVYPIVVKRPWPWEKDAG